MDGKTQETTVNVVGTPTNNNPLSFSTNSKSVHKRRSFSTRLSFENSNFEPHDLQSFELSDMNGMTESDKVQNQEMNRMHNTLMYLSREIATLNERQNFLGAKVQENASVWEVQEQMENIAFTLNQMQSQYDSLRQSLEKVARERGATAVLISDQITVLKEQLVAAAKLRDNSNKIILTQQGESEKESAKKIAQEQQIIVVEKAKKILELTAELDQKLASKNGLLESQVSDLQKSIRATVRPIIAARPAWSFRDLWTTDKLGRATSSVQKLAQNKAFQDGNLDSQSDDQLDVSLKVLKLMQLSLYASTHFHQYFPAESVVSSSASVATMASSKTFLPGLTVLVEKDDSIVNHEVLNSYVRPALAAIQKEAGGLIGSPNPRLQFWGKVLMALALAIGAMVAAVAVMSVLGVATPAFLVPYIAYVKATSLVSGLLNLVATKLALDLNVAAAVTAVTTAGAFGVFGKTMHYAGSETALKRDIDRAAQDLEAAIAETPAIRRLGK